MVYNINKYEIITVLWATNSHRLQTLWAANCENSL